IAGFVYMGAASEQSRLELRHVLEGMPVAHVMTDRLGEARVDENAGVVARRLLQQNLVGALVVDDGSRYDGASQHAHVLGLVTAWAPARPGPRAASSPVGSAMRPDMPRVHAEDDASKSLDALTSTDAEAVLVLDRDEHVIGMVTPAEIQRAMTLLGAAGR